MIYFIFFVLLLSFFLLVIRKWEMNPKKSIPWSIIMVLLGTIILFFFESDFPHYSLIIKIIISASIPIVISILTVAYFFFRDPERIPPQTENVILSPADGKVIYINRDF